MADRSVKVRLEGDVDNFKRALAEAAAVTAGFAKSVGGTKGPLTNLEKDSRRAGNEIDRLSGRLRLFRDIGLAIGPALAPIGAGMVPLVGALATGLAATALAGGTAVLALVGMGDALTALNDYQLEPTAENLQKVRLQMEKLGPDGAHFVKFLDDARPALESLQMAAREGLLPGVEEGITALLTDLPQIRDLISQTAHAMGELTGDAGADLAGPEWESFWEYLQTDAAPTLEAMGRTIGNFAQGFAGLVVGLAPATRDFTTGLEGLSQRFADWSAGLENNEGFQEFLDYVRQSGPQVARFMGELVSAVAALGQAMAPFGAVVLPALTQLLEVFAALARTDVGGIFVAAAAGMAIYTRGAAGAAAATGLLTKAMSPWALAAGAVAVTVTEVASANDELVAATQRAQDALNSGDTSQMQTELDNLNAKLDETKLKMYPDDVSFTDSLPLVGGMMNGLEQAGDLWTRFGGATDDAKAKVGELESALESGRGGLFGFTDGVDAAAAGLQEAEQAAADFQSAIAELDAWLSKRGAIRNYREQIQGLAKGLKDGFNREDRENIDATAEAIARVAEQIKDPGVRADFMKNARASLMQLAENAGPKARAEIQKVIGKLDEFGLTKPRSPKLNVDTSGVRAAVNAAMSWLNGIPDETVNINVVRRYKNALSSGTPSPTPGTEDQLYGGGRTSRRARGPYGDYMGRGDIRGGGLFASGANLTDNGVNGLSPALNTVHELKNALRDFRMRLDEATKAVDREKRQRDELVDASRAFAQAVGNAYAKADPFAGGLSDFDTATAANTNDSNAAAAALAAAAAQGLNGPLYQALAASGNLALLQEFAGLTAAQIEIKEQQFASQSQAQAGLGAGAAAHEFAQAIKEQTKELREAQKERKKYAGLVKEVERRLDLLPDRVERGARRGVRDRDGQTAAHVRAGG